MNQSNAKRKCELRLNTREGGAPLRKPYPPSGSEPTGADCRNKTAPKGPVPEREGGKCDPTAKTGRTPPATVELPLQQEAEIAPPPNFGPLEGAARDGSQPAHQRWSVSRGSPQNPGRYSWSTMPMRHRSRRRKKEKM
mmetsp:Transcript_18911/g.49209  ORF Transcript_18911/g.49209 Transcript_18911/m.49209 type:complete len:138 (-) Transcript_18911:890-1303(-)